MKGGRKDEIHKTKLRRLSKKDKKREVDNHQREEERR